MIQSLLYSFTSRPSRKIKAAFIAIAATEEGRAIIRAIYNHEGYAEAVDSEYDIVRTYLERQEDWDF